MSRCAQHAFGRRAVLLCAVAALLHGAVVMAQAPDAAAAGETPEQQTETKMTFLELLMKGEWFMVPIGACSLVGLAIVLERLAGLRRSAIIPRAFNRDLQEMFSSGQQDGAAVLAHCEQHPCAMARVLTAGLRRLSQGQTVAEQSIVDAGMNEVAKMRRNLRMLYGIAAVAPMLGLLGTVWGMIEAFQVASTQGLGRAEMLAGGIYEALVTTFAGLMVAIPLLVFYYYFLGRIERLVSEMNDLSEQTIHQVSP